MEQHHDTASLNDLIEVLNDGKQFYEEASGKVARADLKSLFARMAAHKADVAQRLAVAVQALGDNPAKAGSFSGSIRKAYAEIRTKLAHDTDYEYVAQLEEFEDRILHGFQDALKIDKDPAVRQVADHYFSGVKSDHDLMRDLKHQGAQRVRTA